jgi:hypothetical protein
MMCEMSSRVGSESDAIVTDWLENLGRHFGSPIFGRIAECDCVPFHALYGPYSNHLALNCIGVDRFVREQTSVVTEWRFVERG